MIHFRTPVFHQAVEHIQEVGQFPRAGSYEQLTYLVLWISWAQRNQENCRVIMIYHIDLNLNMQYTGIYIYYSMSAIFKKYVLGISVKKMLTFRLILLAYLPSGFWSRLLTRILADDSVVEILRSYFIIPQASYIIYSLKIYKIMFIPLCLIFNIFTVTK